MIENPRVFCICKGISGMRSNSKTGTDTDTDTDTGTGSEHEHEQEDETESETGAANVFGGLLICICKCEVVGNPGSWSFVVGVASRLLPVASFQLPVADAFALGSFGSTLTFP